MSFGDHALDEIRVGRGDVDFAFAVVVACYEEGCCEAVGLEDVEELGGVFVWAVVVGKRYDVVLNTIVDVVCVCDGALQWPWNVLG